MLLLCQDRQRPPPLLTVLPGDLVRIIGAVVAPSVLVVDDDVPLPPGLLDLLADLAVALSGDPPQFRAGDGVFPAKGDIGYNARVRGSS